MASEKSLQSSILASMRLKTIDELTEIWQKNDHTEWTDDTFDVVRGLLLERLGTLPEQNSPLQIVETKESIANEILKDYQNKRGLSLLVDFLWIFCLLQTGVLLMALILWIGLTINNETLVFKDVWFSILFTLLAIPVYFLRRKIKNSTQLAKKKILNNIGKALE